MPVSENTGSDLGGWDPAELESTLHDASNAGADHDIEPHRRFVRGVAALVWKREALVTDDEDQKDLAVFLLHPDGEQQSDLPRHPMLDAGLTAIAGKVWYVNAAVVSGRASDLTATEDDAVFRFITDDLGLGDVPAVIVDPRLPQIAVRFYPAGLSDPNNREEVRLTTTDVNIAELSRIIERVYTQCLVTPDAQPEGNRIWNDGSKHRPKRNAEHRIQASLKPAFAAVFPTCRVYDEFAGTMGRADLHIEEPDPLDRTRVTFLAVLELKVLRSYSENGDTAYSVAVCRAAVSDGVRQAGMYKRERGHRVGALCCFDMREQDEGDECFEEVAKLADDLGIALRRWYLYGTSRLYRNAEASTP